MGKRIRREYFSVEVGHHLGIVGVAHAEHGAIGPIKLRGVGLLPAACFHHLLIFLGGR